jgi:glyoxalase family protein
MTPAYHLYYGDGVGSPGTIITFFPWPRAPQGRRGTGQVTAASFLIPSGAVDYWAERLNQHRTSVQRNAPRFGEPVISFSDPDGLALELIASDDVVAAGSYESGEVPPAYAIRGLHSATLTEEAYQKTAALLNETMGFQLVGQEGNRYRYSVGSGQPASSVDVLCAPEQRRGNVLTGTVHHIAWRTPDDASQKHVAPRTHAAWLAAQFVCNDDVRMSTTGGLQQLAEEPHGCTEYR